MGTTVRIRTRDVLCGRLPRPSDDSGNIAMLMLVIIVSATIGTLLLAIVLNQTSTTRFSSTRVRSLDAAQAGIDVMLGQLRSATTTGSDGKTVGDADRLPCALQATPINGTANAAGTMTYSVWVTYYRTDPSKGSQPAMTCAPNYGPFDSTSGSHTPRYAVITSFGLDSSNPKSASKGRTLTTTYLFQSDDVNIPGGQIQLYSDASAAVKYCMDAGSSAPLPGTAVVLQTCSNAQPTPAQQVWSYRRDLSIQLVSSVTTTNPSGLCLDTSTPLHAVDDKIVLTNCSALGSAPYNQIWSFNDQGRLAGSLVDKSGTNLTCITASAPQSNTYLTLAVCNGSINASDVQQTWVPSTTTGAGGAGAANNQIVNYQNFATCVDVPGKDPTLGYLILFPCKQNPNASSVSWNEKFSAPLGPASSTAPPQTGSLTTTSGGVGYCLKPPQTVGGFATVSSTACSTTWTWNQTKDSTGNPLPYANIYTITTTFQGAQYCLAPGPKVTPAMRSYNLNYLYFTVIMTDCTGGTEQKWNADPSVLLSRLTNTGEK